MRIPWDSTFEKATVKIREDKQDFFSHSISDFPSPSGTYTALRLDTLSSKDFFSSVLPLQDSRMTTRRGMFGRIGDLVKCPTILKLLELKSSISLRAMSDPMRHERGKKDFRRTSRRERRKGKSLSNQTIYWGFLRRSNTEGGNGKKRKREGGTR